MVRLREKPGVTIWRDADLPSRAMNLQGLRSLALKTKDFQLSLTQAGTERTKASGSIRDTRTGKEFQLVEAGILQTG